MVIKRAKIQNYNVINLEVDLPGSAAILAHKDKPVFQKLDFWTCAEGILYPRYAHFCSLLVINDDVKNRSRIDWVESVILVKSCSFVSLSLLY